MKPLPILNAWFLLIDGEQPIPCLLLDDTNRPDVQRVAGIASLGKPFYYDVDMIATKEQDGMVFSIFIEKPYLARFSFIIRYPLFHWVMYISEAGKFGVQFDSQRVDYDPARVQAMLSLRPEQAQAMLQGHRKTMADSGS